MLRLLRAIFMPIFVSVFAFCAAFGIQVIVTEDLSRQQQFEIIFKITIAFMLTVIAIILLIKSTS